MSSDRPEPWLSGPVAGIPTLLQPAAHAFVMAGEDIPAAVAGLTAAQLWLQPGGIAPVGFHLTHVAGATDRLLTYARGETLSESQRANLNRERTIAEERPVLDEMLENLRRELERALAQLASTDESTLSDPRFVGRSKLPSTVLGLLFHAAEHAARHTGQIVTTAKLVRALQ